MRLRSKVTEFSCFACFWNEIKVNVNRNAFQKH